MNKSLVNLLTTVTTILVASLPFNIMAASSSASQLVGGNYESNMQPNYPYVTSTIMHATTSSVDSTTYSPACFPATSNYSEQLLDSKIIGNYNHPTGGVSMYRCMRISNTSNNAASYSGWQSNPNNASEIITTDYKTYGQFAASVKKTGFQISCQLDTPQGGYNYRYYGFNLQYTDIYGTTQTITGYTDSGSNCGQSGVTGITPQTVLGGWIGIQITNFTGNGGTNIDCSSTGYIAYYLPPNQTGKTCTFSAHSPQSSSVCGNHCSFGNCSVVNMSCS
jgi:hypothetical protein